MRYVTSQILRQRFIPAGGSSSAQQTGRTAYSVLHAIALTYRSRERALSAKLPLVKPWPNPSPTANSHQSPSRIKEGAKPFHLMAVVHAYSFHLKVYNLYT